MIVKGSVVCTVAALIPMRHCREIRVQRTVDACSSFHVHENRYAFYTNLKVILLYKLKAKKD